MESYFVFDAKWSESSASFDYILGLLYNGRARAFEFGNIQTQCCL